MSISNEIVSEGPGAGQWPFRCLDTLKGVESDLGPTGSTKGWEWDGI